MISINDNLHVAMVETSNHYTFWCKCHVGEAPTAVAFIDGCMLHCTRLASDCYVKQVTGYGYVHVLGAMRDVRLYHYLGCSVIQIYCYQRSGFLQCNGLHYLFSITVMQGFKTSRYKSCRKNLLVQSFCLVPLLIHTLLKGQIQFTSLAGILYMKPYELLQSRSAMMVLSIE